MVIRHHTTLLAACLVLVLGSATPGYGLSVSGRASTVLEWFDDAQENTAVPAYQYLLLNVKDLDGDGLNFRGYGRLADDLAGEVDIDSRLYYAYLEKRRLFERLDVRLGRQFISTTAGASVMDGAQLRLHDLGPFALELFGGGDVRYDENYSAEDWLAGGELSGRFFGSLDLGLSYIQKWDDGDLGYELFGFDLDYRYRDLLDLYSETQFDYLSNSVSYFLAGAHYHRSSDWGLRAEYLYSLPVFSATSIYSVFAVSEYQEAMLEATVNWGDGARGFFRFTQEMYDELSDASVIELGAEQVRIRQFSGYLTLVARKDEDGQDLKGLKARAAYLFTEKFQAGVGAHLDVLERHLEDDDDTTSKRLWVDATAYLSKAVDLQAKLERVESGLWDDYYRGRVRLNVRF